MVAPWIKRRRAKATAEVAAPAPVVEKVVEEGVVQTIDLAPVVEKVVEEAAQVAPAPVVEKVVEKKPAPKRRSYRRKPKTEE